MEDLSISEIRTRDKARDLRDDLIDATRVMLDLYRSGHLAGIGPLPEREVIACRAMADLSQAARNMHEIAEGGSGVVMINGG